MDSILLSVIGSSVIVIGSIIFAVGKIQNNIKEIGDNINKTVLDNVKILSENIDNFKISNQMIVEESITKIENLIKTQNEQLNKNINRNYEATLESNDKTKLTVLNELKLLNSKIISSINDVKNDTQNFSTSFEKYQINNKNQLENNFQNTVRLVNNLRLDNLINVSNEIGKYKNGVVEDEHFLQEVGSCKIIKLTDKQSGEITEVYYNEDGEKSHTQTFLNNVLKYEMQYSNGVLSKGFEYNDEGQVIFAYGYDEAGEISTKIEYEYDNTGKQIEKSKIKY